MAPKQTDPQFKLRLPPELKQAVEEAAIANNRSMNAEIIERLQCTLTGEGDNARRMMAMITQNKDFIENTRELINHQKELISSQKSIIASQRQRIDRLLEQNEEILWEIIANADDIPNQLTLWADIMLRLGGAIKDAPDDDESIDAAFKAPDVPENKALIESRVARAKQRFENKLKSISDSFEKAFPAKRE